MKLTWEEHLEQGVCDVAGLNRFLSLDEEEGAALARIIEKYPLAVSLYYLGLIDPGDPADPIRRMCIPDPSEFSEGGQADTSGEAENTVLRGLQHKYRQTALILSTSRCAMYCRHCFRKRMVGEHSEEVAEQIPAMAAYVRAHPEINNVLISGGDSFMNTNETIEAYLEAFSAIPSLDFLRFGTRLPVVLPQRILEDAELLRLLKAYGAKKPILIITQFNHPRELTPESSGAIALLREAGCIVRNQTVLLRGVNDRAEVLAALLNGLVAHGALPYYIFQCRPVAGVQNRFQLSLRTGAAIVEAAKREMNGQAKAIRYALSHPSGKIEILGPLDESRMLFKYHQAKYEQDAGRIFAQEIGPEQCWIEGI